MSNDRGSVPDRWLDELRWRCLALPEAVEESAWAGTRWTVRGKNFAHVLMIDRGWPPAYARATGIEGRGCVLTFRSSRVEIDPDYFERPPFFRPRWWPDIAGLVLDEDTDWREVSTLIEASYLRLAPRKLAARAAAPRPVMDAEMGELARLWFDGWKDAHADRLPQELTRHRTLESFTARCVRSGRMQP